MTHLSLGSRFSALFSSTSTSTAQQKQTGTNCSRPYALGTTSSSAARTYTRGGDRSTDTDTLIIIMGKSNHFDYSKRGSEGAKLGHLISRDLKREVEKATKDAEKAAGKARKRSTGSSSSGSRDAASHTIDLQVPSKHLGDEGACAMAEGLEVALRDGSVLLEDINLSGNGITALSLARLAPIIRLARHDLKSLNLARNEIKVETVEEAVQWESFLRAFKDCFKLRRLDLDGNVKLGAKAFEIMAKIHLSEPPINPMPYNGETSVVSIHSQEDLVALTQASSLNEHDHMSSGGIIKRRLGLRSIPFITLTDTGLDDVSALWLSFVLEEHHYPNQLIDGLNATLATSAVSAYQQITNSRGIDWDVKDPSKNRDGLYLLQKAENFREQVMLAEDEAFDTAEFELHDTESRSVTTRLGDRRASRAPGDRRASIRSIRTADGGEHELSELESARKRLQRSIIDKYGPSRVELWSTALRLVISSRVLVGIGPKTKNAYTGPPKFDFTSYNPPVVADKKPSTPRPVTPCNKLSFDRRPNSPNTPSRQGTYAATLTGEPDVLSTDITNTPRTPKILFKPHRKSALSDGSEAIQRSANSLVVRDRNPQRFVQWQEERMKKHELERTPFRDDGILSHLPSFVVDLIAGFTVTEREKQLLSDKQLQAALAWGRRRPNFETEKEWWRMSDCSQTWTLLESIDCLAYHRQ